MSKDPTNSIKVLNENINTQITQKYNKSTEIQKTQQIPAPSAGRVTKPERQWDCHRGTPKHDDQTD